MFPILFEIPGLGWPIFSYGVMLGLSIIIGWYFTLWLSERDGLPRRTMGNCYFWGIAASLAGARLLYLITNPDELNSPGDFFRFREGGLVAYGGFLGGLLGSWAFCHLKRINIWAWADCTAAPIALGLAITRIGCFCYGCCFGRRVTEDSPGWLQAIALRFPNWSIRFPELAEQELTGAPAWSHHVAHLGLDPAAAASYAIIPTQLMESLNGLLVVGVLMLLRRVRRFRGLLFLSAGVWYGVTRFLLEIARDDTQRGTIGPPLFGWVGGFDGRITTSQAIAVATVLASAAGLVYFWLRSRRDPEAAMALGEGASEGSAEDGGGAKPASSRSKRSGGKKRKK
jgi:phosphatidylglycerol:prolipoprotein diacylglycerol transferase